MRIRIPKPHPLLPSNVIYELVDPRDGATRYVGQSTRGIERILAHYYKRNDTTLTHHHANWIRSVCRDGGRYDSRILQVLPDDATQKALDDAEVYWIARRRADGCDLTNTLRGGGGTRGYRHSDAAKAKISVASKLMWQDPITGAALREARADRRGIPMSENAKEQSRKARTGQKRSRESCLAMSVAARGRVRVQSPEEIRNRMNPDNRPPPVNPGTRINLLPKA